MISQARSYRGFAHALLAVAIWPFATDNFELPRLWLLGVLSLMLLRRAPDVSTTVRWLGISWVLVAIVGTATSASPAMSSSALLAVVAYVAFAMVSAPFNPRSLLWVVWPVAAYAALQRLGFDPVNWSDPATWCGSVRPFSTLGHPGQLAGWLALLLPFAVDRLVDGSSLGLSFRERATRLGTLILLVTTLVLTLARAGWLAAGAGVVTWAVVRPVAFTPRRWLAATATLAVTLIGLWQVSWVHQRLLTFLEAPTRLHLAQSAMSAWRARPIFGQGLDTFILVSEQFRVADAWRYEWGATPQNAHGLLWQVAATLGSFGLLFLGAVGALIVRALWQRGRANPAVAGAVVAFSVGNAFTFYGVATTALGVSCMAWLWSAESDRPAPRPTKLTIGFGALVVCTFVGAALAASTVAHQAREKPPDEAARGYQLAHRLEPLNPIWPVQEGARFENAARHGDTNSWPRALQAYQQAVAIESMVAQYWANVGRAAAAMADRAKSASAFDHAMHLAPLDARIALDAAEASLRASDLVKAEQQLTALATQRPTWSLVWWSIADLRWRQGRAVEERAALEVALNGHWLDWPEGRAICGRRLARVLVENGDAERAESVLTRPVEASPDVCGAPAAH